MSAESSAVANALNRQFFLDFPAEAARQFERLSIKAGAGIAASQRADSLLPVWQRLLPGRAAELMQAMPDSLVASLLEALPPPQAVRILGLLPEEERAQQISRLDPEVQADLQQLMSYPPATAGRYMDLGVATFRQKMTVAQALRQLKQARMKTARSLFLVDDDHRLTGKVALQDLALAAPGVTLGELEQPVPVALRPVDSLDEVTSAFETHRVLDIPVINLDGVFIGAVTHDRIANTIQQATSVDIQTMVGASKDERALSAPFFAVRKRMPWLQINLLTAFLAAAVVGIFENTIAQVTALAVLLPVVAGQSGNAGAQALAVTMRGLALREITTRHWLRVMRKEVVAGAMNGIAIALTCGLGVYIWSGSLPLVAVISVSMVLAMIAAGFAGAVIPILLTRLGQDPATSSSILLTTVTDVAGFFSFLGIATIFMRFL